MKFEKKFQIEKVASKDENRYILNGVYLDTKKKQLIATDGRKLAIVPCKPDKEDTSQIIPKVAIIEHRKSRPGKKFEVLELTCNGKIEYEVKGGKGSSEKVDGNFPNYQQVIPKWDNLMPHEFSINPKFLFDLAMALGSPDAVTLKVCVAYYDDSELDPAGAPVIVTANSSPKALGVLMPLRLNK